jgi:hypothetical protein
LKTIQLQVAVSLDDANKESITSIFAEAVQRSMVFASNSLRRDEALRHRPSGEIPDDRTGVWHHFDSDPLALLPRDAAKALQISPRLLWLLSKDGKVPCTRVDSGKRQTLLYSVGALTA